MNEKGSASAQIIYYCSTSPRSIPGIIIYIFTTRKVSTKYGRQSTEGGARGGRLSVDDASN